MKFIMHKQCACVKAGTKGVSVETFETPLNPPLKIHAPTTSIAEKDREIANLKIGDNEYYLKPNNSNTQE